MPHVRLWVLVLSATLLTARVEAQAPTIDSTAVAARAERLPVLDNSGNVIAESEIAALIRPGRWRVTKVVIGGLLGLIAFAAASDPGPMCVDWDPCSPREEWMMNAAPWFGMLIGGLTFAAIPGGVDRWHAIELIRAQRDAAKQGRAQ